MQVRVAVNAEVDLAALNVGNSLCNVHGHGAGLGVRHEVTGTQHLTQATNFTHHIGGCNCCVEVGPAARDLSDQLVRTDIVSARCLSCGSLIACSNNNHAGGLTGAVRQVHGAANHLVGLTGVNRKAQSHLNGCISFSGGSLLRQGYCLGGGVEFTLFNLGYSRLVRLAALCHLLISLCSCGLVSRARLCHIPRSNVGIYKLKRENRGCRKTA